MKKILLFLLLVSFVCGDELKRIESIVADITELRVKYKECKNSLETRLENDQKENEKIIKKLENQIVKYENLLKTKEKEILVLKNKKPKKVVKRTMKKQACKPIKVDKPNEFPKLVLKDQYSKDIVKTEPFTYRFKNDAFIYDDIDGKKIDEWEGETSFTSNVRSESWVKITGYFVDRVWVRSKSSMWVKIKDVRKR